MKPIKIISCVLLAFQILLSCKKENTDSVSASPKEVNLDVTINGIYTFSMNNVSGINAVVYAALCQIGDCPPLPPPTMSIIESFDIPALGQFNFRLNETSDIAAASNNHNTTIVLDNMNYLSVSGECSVNFKQLIQRGGGLFNGTYQITKGSAMSYDQNVFANLDPLTVTGNLDTTMHTVNMTTKGKVYF